MTDLRARMRREANAEVLARLEEKGGAKLESEAIEGDSLEKQGFHSLTWLPEGEAPFQEDDVDKVFS